MNVERVQADVQADVQTDVQADCQADCQADFQAEGAESWLGLVRDGPCVARLRLSRQRSRRCRPAWIADGRWPT